MRILLQSCAMFALLASVAAGDTLTGRVERVLSGDTIDVTIAGKKERIRMHGIAAPVRRQAGHEAARDHARKVIGKHPLTIESMYRDRYNRIIANVRLPDETFVNLAMVKDGHAWHYVRFARDDKALAEAQAEARKAGVGLWADSGPTPPWEFQAAREAR